MPVSLSLANALDGARLHCPGVKGCPAAWSPASTADTEDEMTPMKVQCPIMPLESSSDGESAFGSFSPTEQALLPECLREALLGEDEGPKKIQLPFEALRWGGLMDTPPQEERPEQFLARGSSRLGCAGLSTGPFPAVLSVPAVAKSGVPLAAPSPKQRLSLEAALPPGPAALNCIPLTAASTILRLGLATPKQVARSADPIAVAALGFGHASEEASTSGSPVPSIQSQSSEASDQESAIPTSALSGPFLTAPPGLITGTTAPQRDAPSLGSVLHSAGACRPCAWFWKEVGCQNGAACTYCHACNEGALKAKKKNKVTMKRLGMVTPTTADSTPTSLGNHAGSQAKFALSLASLI